MAENSKGDIFILADAVYKYNGVSWSKILEIELDPYGSSIIIYPNDEIFIRKDYNTVYHSTDNGETWQELLFFLGFKTFTNEGDIFIPKEGGILKSTDNGITWTLKNDGLDCVDYLNAFMISKSGIMCVVTCYRNLYISTDRGENWILTGYLDWGSIEAINSQGHLFSLQGSNILVSTDNGTTWQVIYNEPDPYTRIRQLVIDSNDNLYISLAYKGIYRSINNGESWESFNEGLPNLDIQNLYVSKNGYLYACPTGSGLWIINLQEIPLTSIARNYDIYPNPSNNVITVTSLLYPEVNNDFISIYNLQGLLVKRVTANKQAVVIDVTDLPRGIYVVNSSSSKESQKLIVQ